MMRSISYIQMGEQNLHSMLYLTWMNVALLLIIDIVISRSIRDKNTIPK